MKRRSLCGQLSRRDLLVGAGGLGMWAAVHPMLHAQQAAAARADRLPDIKMMVFDTFGTVIDWRGTIIAEGRELSQAKSIEVSSLLSTPASSTAVFSSALGQPSGIF